MEQIAGKGDARLSNGSDDRDGSEGVSGGWEDEEVVMAVAEGGVVGEKAGDGEVVGDGVEVVPHVVEVEHAAIAPEVGGFGEQAAFVGGDGDRDVAFDGAEIALALVAMVVSVEDPVHFGDAEVLEMVEDAARSEVDQHRTGAVADDVDVAGVLEKEQVVRQFAGLRVRCESGFARSGALGLSGCQRKSGGTEKIAAGLLHGCRVAQRSRDRAAEGKKARTGVPAK